MIVASAQTCPHRFQIEKNLDDHYTFIKLAASHNAALVVFPEMSVTGYEREQAAEMAFVPGDGRLSRLQDLSSEYGIIVIAGAPLLLDNRLHIGSFVMMPDGEQLLYTKQFLHTGEDVSFISGNRHNPLIETGGERISLAICADTDHPEHPYNASLMQTTLYVPSIFFSPGGLPGAFENFSNYARKYKMSVLMSNFCRESWGRPAGGRSAYWDNQGRLIGSMDSSNCGLLVVDTHPDSISAKAIYI